MAKKRILVIDDSTTNLMAMQKVLQKDNFEVEISVSAEESLKNIPDLNIDLILLDIMMPGMSGYEFLDAISTIPEIHKIPVIVISAQTAATEIEKALLKGAVDYIKKPIDITELLARVHAALRTVEKYKTASYVSEMTKEVLSKDFCAKLDKCVKETQDKTTKEVLEKCKLAFDKIK